MRIGARDLRLVPAAVVAWVAGGVAVGMGEGAWILCVILWMAAAAGIATARRLRWASTIAVALLGGAVVVSAVLAGSAAREPPDLVHAAGHSRSVELTVTVTGMTALARLPNDGYTLGILPAAVLTLTPYLYKNPQFNIDTDYTPIAAIATGPMMVVVNSNSDIQSLADLVRVAKAQPGKLNFAAMQTNSVPHLTGEMLSRTTGMKLTTVPYASSPASTTALLSGEANLTIDGLPALTQYVKAGKFRALAVTSPNRLPGFENVPTVAETFKGFEALGWFALFAPAGLAPDIVEKINRDVNRVVQAPDLVARFADFGIYPKPGSPKALTEFVDAQRATWKKVVMDLDLKPQ